VPLFTGIDSAYEAPERPEVMLPADEAGIDDCVLRLIDFLENRGNIPSRDAP